MPRPRTATYRIQLTPDFGFSETAEIVADLAALGISHLYLSPVAEAIEASTHGYDVVRPWEVRAELGGREGLWALARAVRDTGMGLIIDVVPNHVATSQPERNPWWWTLLAEGRDCPVAAYFDVDWDQGDGQVIVPTLGAHPEEVIASGELGVDGDKVRYHDKTFPLSTQSRADGDRGGSGRTGHHQPAPSELGELLDRQHYRLTHWRDPQRNVRRFFTIDDLVAIRPEIPSVADAVISIAEELTAHGLLDGVRVDHIDGLAEPGAYLADLRSRLGADSWLLVEKILVGDETLAPTWAVDGTTGYEWIRIVDHLFTNPAGHSVFPTPVGLPGQPSTEQASDDDRSYHAVEQTAIREVLRGELLPDLERLARVTASALNGRTSTTGTGAVSAVDLLEPLIELTAQLGRYRTYLPTDLSAGAATDVTDCPDRSDRTVIESAARRAGELLDPPARELLGRVVGVMLECTEVTRRWQQLSGPALAKGGEDRALYRFIRLSAHNEVGGDPSTWSASLDAFHEHNAHVAAHSPCTLLAGTTHDTKRSEDTRARLLALTELPDRWTDTVSQWRSELEAAEQVSGEPGEPAVELALQTVVAAWPIDAGRLGDYLVKAAREAGLHTSWTDPDEAHENALRSLAGHLTGDPFPGWIEALLQALDPAARSISLAQLALRLTAPGVPDLYQGSQDWLHTLVDPDNRGPLDVENLRRLIRSTHNTVPTRSIWDAPSPKAALIRRVLAIRAGAPACFAAGSRYLPIRARGDHADHVIAFQREAPGEAAAPGDKAAPGDTTAPEAVVTVAARFTYARSAWGDTHIDLPGTWRDVLDAGSHHAGDGGDGTVMLSELLAERPCAVLVER